MSSIGYAAGIPAGAITPGVYFSGGASSGDCSRNSGRVLPKVEEVP